MMRVIFVVVFFPPCFPWKALPGGHRFHKACLKRWSWDSPGVPCAIATLGASFSLPPWPLWGSGLAVTKHRHAASACLDSAWWFHVVFSASFLPICSCA